MQEVKARGGKLIVVTDAAESARTKRFHYADHIISSAFCPAHSLSPIDSRSLAAYWPTTLRYLRGCDVDQPRNLS